MLLASLAEMTVVLGVVVDEVAPEKVVSVVVLVEVVGIVEVIVVVVAEVVVVVVQMERAGRKKDV